MRTNVGNRDAVALYKGSLSGATFVPGDGLTPSRPIVTHGGYFPIICDVDVPAIVAGNTADWNATYPAFYSSPSPSLDLIRYMAPLDTTKKLHSKGAMLITRARVMLGITVTGAGEPTQVAGTVIITIKRFGVTPTLWAFNGTMPTAAGVPGCVISPTSVTDAGVIIGTDFGVERLIMTVDAVGANIVAGRYRVALEGYEV